MPEVFENESSFVCRKIVFGDVRAAIGTNGLQAGAGGNLKPNCFLLAKCLNEDNYFLSGGKTKKCLRT